MGPVAGVDVSRDGLVVYFEGRLKHIRNDDPSVQAWLSRLPRDAVVGFEATGRFGRLLADLAYRQGHVVYELNPRKVRRYGRAVSERAKTDRVDARVIAEFVQHHHERLHPYVPLTEDLKRLSDLLGERTALMEDGVRQDARWREFRLGLPGQERLREARRETLRELDKCIEVGAAAYPLFALLQSVPGIGPLTAAQAVLLFQRYPFESEDAFIAYLGLDLVTNDSGLRTGTKRLSRKGHKRMRRLLYMAALSGCQMAVWAPYYQKKVAELRCKTKALIALARKLAKTLYGIARTGVRFDISRLGLDMRP